ncbi:hypothetical protein ACIQVR_39810 [Streptomyces xanthochromogenes]|uniref:hypothetical protein n=1 Tax=Streptomyces xanthochromogenes TaxID=67384 RepID=UPI0037F846C3
MTNRDDPNWLWEFRAEDFVHARLREDLAAAEALPEGDERDAAVIRVESLRLAVVQHSPYVDDDGKSWGRCFTCPGSCGFPCSTMRYFTRMWRHHPDYRPGWNDTLDGQSGPSSWERDQLRLAELGGYRHEFLADHPEAA